MLYVLSVCGVAFKRVKLAAIEFIYYERLRLLALCELLFTLYLHSGLLPSVGRKITSENWKLWNLHIKYLSSDIGFNIFGICPNLTVETTFLRQFWNLFTITTKNICHILLTISYSKSTYPITPVYYRVQCNLDYPDFLEPLKWVRIIEVLWNIPCYDPPIRCDLWYNVVHTTVETGFLDTPFAQKLSKEPDCPQNPVSKNPGFNCTYIKICVILPGSRISEQYNIRTVDFPYTTVSEQFC